MKPVKTIYLTTPGDISSKEEYVKGTLKIGRVAYDIDIRGRGGSTWAKPKNPYKIKLKNKRGLLGFPNNTEFALLAHWYDGSCLREELGRHIGRVLDLGWVPRSRRISLHWNGNYHGLYLFSETVKVGKNRLNIDTDKGEYLVEANWKEDKDTNWGTSSGVRLSMIDPKIPENISEIQSHFQTIEDELTAYHDVSHLINQDSWIKTCIMQEVMKNRDAVLYGSVFFYRKKNKIYMGVPWDFDLSTGGYDTNTVDGWSANHANIIQSLFRYDEAYKVRYKAIWNYYKPQIQKSITWLDKQTAELKQHQERNFDKWHPLQLQYPYPGQIIRGSVNEEVEAIKDFLTKRIAWMDAETKNL